MNSAIALAAGLTLIFATSAIPCAVRADTSSFRITALPICTSQPASGAGCRGVPDFDVAEANRRLAGQAFTYWVDGTVLRMAARTRDATPPRLCCSFQDYMKPLGQQGAESLWGAQYDLPHLDQSILTLSLAGTVQTAAHQYRGPNAPAAAVGVTSLKGHLETIDINSENLGETRKVTLYTPAAPPPQGGYPVIYIADGMSVTSFAPRVEKLIDDGKISPVLLIGIWSSDRRPDATHRFDGRSNEYMPDAGFDPISYAHHEQFVLNEVMPLAETRYHASTYRDRRLTFGYSNGASWAIAFATRHADLFAQGSGMAAGMDAASLSFAGVPKGFQLFVGAGEYDLLRYSTYSICDKARGSGLKCRYVPLYTGHDPAMWDYGLEQALVCFFHPSPFN